MNSLSKLIRAEKKMFSFGYPVRKKTLAAGDSRRHNSKHKSWKLKRTKMIGEV